MHKVYGFRCLYTNLYICVCVGLNCVSHHQLGSVRFNHGTPAMKPCHQLLCPRSFYIPWHSHHGFSTFRIRALFLLEQWAGAYCSHESEKKPMAQNDLERMGINVSISWSDAMPPCHKQSKESCIAHLVMKTDDVAAEQDLACNFHRQQKE